MRNIKRKISALLAITMLFSLSACDDNKETSSNVNVSTYSNETTEPAETSAPEFQRVRDYVYDVSELSSLDLTGYEHIYVQGKLEYDGHGYNENEHFEIDLGAGRDKYSFDMRLYGYDDTWIDCSFITLGNEATEYQFGDYLNIQDYAGQDIVMYCCYTEPNDPDFVNKGYKNKKKTYLRCCQPVKIDEIDEFHDKQEQYKKELLDNKVTIDDIEEDLHNDPFGAYFKYNSYMMNLEGIYGTVLGGDQLFDSTGTREGKYQELFWAFLYESLYIQDKPAEGSIFNKNSMIVFFDTNSSYKDIQFYNLKVYTEDYLKDDEKMDISIFS